MAPNSHTYFDHYQSEDRAGEPLAIGGFLPLEKVHGYEPIPPQLTADEAQHVLGAQGQLWTEYMKTPEHVEYMAFPRLCALAEVVWSPRDGRDFAEFSQRLASHLARLDALMVNYRK
jgi:hexosaminidase